MSRVALSGNLNGTGTFTIASPNSNTDRTLTLPDATGTVQVSGNPISGTTGTFSGAVSGTTGTFSGAVSGTTGSFPSGVSVGPSVTFGDATVQTTAVAVNTTTVLAATAGASVGAVGTYAFLRRTGATVAVGGTAAGSGMSYGVVIQVPCATTSVSGSGTPAGTWRAMGYGYGGCGQTGGTLWLRIS